MQRRVLRTLNEGEMGCLNPVRLDAALAPRCFYVAEVSAIYTPHPSCLSHIGRVPFSAYTNGQYLLARAFRVVDVPFSAYTTRPFSQRAQPLRWFSFLEIP
jgi:hypothetical protein